MIVPITSDLTHYASFWRLALLAMVCAQVLLFTPIYVLLLLILLAVRK